MTKPLDHVLTCEKDSSIRATDHLPDSIIDLREHSPSLRRSSAGVAEYSEQDGTFHPLQYLPLSLPYDDTCKLLMRKQVQAR